jgi:hypothetical protein
MEGITKTTSFMATGPRFDPGVLNRDGCETRRVGGTHVAGRIAGL